MTRWSETELRRALRVAQKAGLVVSGFEITADGTIRVLTGPAMIAAPPTQTLEPPEVDWRARQKTEVEQAIRSAREKCSRETIHWAFLGSPDLTKFKVGKMLGINPPLLDLASFFGFINRTQIGGVARFTEGEVLKMLGL